MYLPPLSLDMPLDEIFHVQSGFEPAHQPVTTSGEPVTSPPH